MSITRGTSKRRHLVAGRSSPAMGVPAPDVSADNVHDIRTDNLTIEEETPLVQLSELTAAWEAGEEIDLVGQFDSWGEGDRAHIVPPAGYLFDGVRAAG